MEAAAERIVGYFYESLRDETGARACALVRFFKTHPFAALEDEQKAFATEAARETPVAPATRCLTLLATRGDQPEWNSRRASRGHVAIPLTSEKMVRSAPMIAQLVTQLGLDVGSVLQPDPAMIVDLAQRTYNVFHVPEASGSAYIPAQREFVEPYGIRSVLGFGGMLPSGNLFATILFSKYSIGRETADLFANVALGVKLAVLPFDGGVTFATGRADG